MNWKLAAAKQQLSKVVRRAASEPQVLLNRDRPVAVVISADALEDFLKWRQARRASMAQALAEARRICSEDDYRLEVAPRADRNNPLVEGTRHVPRRHQRRQ